MVPGAGLFCGEIEDLIKKDLAGQVFLGEGTSDDYKIGVVLQLLPPPLRAQLQLDEGKGGMMVIDVLKESPASRAGIQKYDIILGCGDGVIQNTEDLVKILNKSKGKEVTLRIIRAGERREIRVKGEKEHKGVVSFVENVVDHPVKIQMVRPAITMRSRLGDLPEGMTVKILKKGKNPATIEVQKGDGRWEATEDRLDSLPGEIRQPVQRMLGMPGLQNYNVGIAVGGKGEGKTEVRKVYSYKLDDGARRWEVVTTPEEQQPKVIHRKVEVDVRAKEKDLEKQIGEMKKQMDRRFQELNQKMEALRKALEERKNRNTGTSNQF